MQNVPHGADELNFLIALRVQMVRFAQLQLGDRCLAEDVVQEALEGAMKNASTLRGEGAWKSWVFAILRHKIADELRQRYRASEPTQSSAQEELDFDMLFDESGHWATGEEPKRWHMPDQAIEQEKFWKIFEMCLSNLPAKHARAFMMREFIGLETPEICQEMDVSVSNLNVILWRARMRLRECLSQRWFEGEGIHA
ncbi:sigma-70 family RNA polymerase sigma factor (plasmid) [Enterobacter sp. JBIWA003]|uniref:sigma-70 family RNA polymerase sigma factor n=1 Tax=Enterobacter sp. JBIWA003 TaxID=2831890 RepID=UPI001CBA8B95|nr:sigma-70 family RNA polymerase sigma factor [Enterobacter sp. JBIWA003]UAN24737.1 sigma-70 family RNA polymerase sigma factor [Enterobacter sp. JBIWA003]